MSLRLLPESPSFENLRKQAKSLLKTANTGDQETLMRVGPYFGDPAKIKLQQAQLVIAREYGFSSWTNLKRHVEAGEISDDLTTEQQANRFLDLVCLHYGYEQRGPREFEQAAELLKQNPDIARHSIHVAAAIGDAASVSTWLSQNPQLVDEKGGPFHWPALMYAAYARLPGVSTFDAGKALLAAGADPNAHYMWGGQYCFTALTGVFGQGEGGPIRQPEHPDCVPFARALLDAGADPNDSQAAYNRCFEPDLTCMELLLEYGLKPEDRNNWFHIEDGEHLPNPSATMQFQLIMAITWGHVERARLIIDHCSDLNRPDQTYDTMHKGRTPYQVAVMRGEIEIAQHLASKGADTSPPEGVDGVIATIMQGDLQAAEAVMQGSPDLRPALHAREQEMLDVAASQGKMTALQCMIDLEFDLNPTHCKGPMHAAAFKDQVQAIQMLLDAGGDPTLRDPNYFGAPMGHAMHSNARDAIALLDQQNMDLFGAAARGRVDLIESILQAAPQAVNEPFSSIRPNPDAECGHDCATPLWFAIVNGRADSVAALVRHGADPKITSPDGRSLEQVAEEHGNTDVLAAMSI